MKGKKLFLILLIVLLLGANISSAQFGKLEITAPENATVGEEITITVTCDGDPIEDATVSIDGLPIGETDSNGQIKHTFNIIGIYRITARKWPSYLSADPFTITIEKPLLVVSLSPLVPNAGEEVTIAVKANLLPIAGATVLIKEDVVGGTYGSIGTTDSNGQVTYTFDEGGTYLIKAEKTGYTSSVPKTLTVLDVELLENITIQGAVFPVPDSLENELLKYEELPLQLPYTSLLAIADKLFVVFSDTQIEKGLASVEGWELAGITWEGLEIGVIRAKDASVAKEGMEVTIDEIKSNPEGYALKLVKIEATIRQISLLVDLDDGSGFRIPITVGRVVKDPINPMDFTDFPGKAYEFDRNRNREYLEQVLNLTKLGLSIFDFETKYWVDCNATVNAIVLCPGVVKGFISAMAGNEVRDLVVPSGEVVLLYNINTELESIDTSIREIKADPERWMGNVVTFTGSDIGVNVSVQETLKETQEIYLPIDLLLHGTAVWCRPPPVFGEIRMGTLITIGVSSHHQDKPVVLVNGALEILQYTGKVVSAKQVNETLNGTMLILYEREKVGDIPIEEIISEAKERIQEKISAIKYILQRKTPEIVHIPLVLSDKTEVIEIERGDVKSIAINLRNKAEDVSISILKLEKRPSEITINASGEVYAYLEINAENISDKDVENVTIEFKVNKSWIIEANVDEKSVRLCRYSEGNWNILSTSIIRETSTEIYYSAESPGLSIYAITSEKEEKSKEDTSEGIPGFELILAIVAIALILFWKRKRMS